MLRMVHKFDPNHEILLTTKYTKIKIYDSLKHWILVGREIDGSH